MTFVILAKVIPVIFTFAEMTFAILAKDELLVYTFAEMTFAILARGYVWIILNLREESKSSAGSMIC